MESTGRGITISFLLCFFLFVHTNPSPRVLASTHDDLCSAWLVQSIPTDMPHLPLVAGVLSTADVFQWLAGNSTRSLDIIAQYWQLVAHPDDPRSGEYGYSRDEMQRFGADEGYRVYQALEDAADRNISIRFLQHSGVYPDFTEEPSAIAAGRRNVKNVTLLLDQWWGSGIVHAKVWISDGRDLFIGSANNDWKSLTQVKEVGIYLVGCPNIAKMVGIYYDNLWKLAPLDSSRYTETVADEQSQTVRKVPCWSHFLDQKRRCKSPLPECLNVDHVAGYPILSDPAKFRTKIRTPGGGISSSEHPSTSYLSFAPPELLFGKHQTDEQGWVETIKSVAKGGTVRISTMDWLGQSQYLSQPVYWSSLSSAISEVVYGKQANVKVVVARWAHFINATDVYLRSLLYTNTLCSSDKKCRGRVEIKYYAVPGYNLTGPAGGGNMYPGYTRVNHGKYVVSDARAHIGTSNLIWDYFYTTAGVSFGTDNPSIVSQLQAIFDADWNSPYAQPLLPSDWARSRS